MLEAVAVCVEYTHPESLGLLAPITGAEAAPAAVCCRCASWARNELLADSLQAPADVPNEKYTFLFYLELLGER